MAKTTPKQVKKTARAAVKVPTIPKSFPLRPKLRFLPDPNTIVALGFHFDGDRGETLSGLVLNESATGFAAILVTSETIEEGATVVCRVGKMSDRYASVRWVKQIEPNLLKVGLQYADS